MRKHRSVKGNFKLRWEIIVGFLIFASACSSSAPITANTFDIQDGGLLSGIPCGSPCFWNITPGVTTLNQTIEILKNMGIYESCTRFDYTAESGRRGLQCSSVTVFLREKADIVSGIGFSPSYDIMLDEIINKYGAPDSVWVTPLGLPESEPKTSMMIYYDHWLMDIRLAEADAATYRLEPSTKVTNIGYHDENSYKAVKRYYTNWKGYGIYDIQMP